MAYRDLELVLDVLGKARGRKTARDTGHSSARPLCMMPSAVRNRAIYFLADHLRQLKEFDAMRILYYVTGIAREATFVDIGHADNLVGETQRAQFSEKIARKI